MWMLIGMWDADRDVDVDVGKHRSCAVLFKRIAEGGCVMPT